MSSAFVPTRRTVFDAPLASALLRGLSRLFLLLSGWRTEGHLPDVPRYVVIAAPHTSNWDLPYTLAVGFVLRARVFWMGKHTIFRRPFGRLFRWLGGIPIDRRQSNNTVDQAVALMREADELALVVAPEGTRRGVSRWKTGFYHIARGAGVPILLGFLDYRRKVGGVGPLIEPTGDVEADMKVIRDFYADIVGKNAAEAQIVPAPGES